MADGHGVAATVGWTGLSLKYVDRTSSLRLGVSTCRPLLPRKTFGAPSLLLRLPSRRILGGRARHGYALSRQGREKLPMDPAPFLRLFVAFVLSEMNFQFAPRIPDFHAGERHMERESIIEKFNDDTLDRNNRNFFLALHEIYIIIWLRLHMSENLIDFIAIVETIEEDYFIHLSLHCAFVDEI